MEERILKYKTDEEIPGIMEELLNSDFLLVRHNAKNKELFFKRFGFEPINKE
ncbi:MAG: hypothetical protein HOE11_05060 [Candidatus Diapherotrites archaeon]|jgi:hypothetical protein|nr:hypothetical protein [Candidatus Diapherotrites archaeon]MBT4596854.1 hypothetical protein [Candidatus Diapherotrites archaeon]